jgi:hypothetical protein
VAGKRIVFTTDRELPSSELAGLPLSSLEIAGPRVRILSNEPEAVLREIFRRGLEVHDLEVAGADLEEAFITLTSHPGQEVPAS